MKKNKTMRAASALLVATLLTTSIISGTFAKYTTEAKGSDAARVAKWGVVLQADGSLYGDKYGTGTNSVPTTNTTVGNLSVSANAKAVAPGTQNDKGLNFSVNGTPEVRTKLTATITSQNIYLKAGTYAVMVKAPTVTATSWKVDTYYTKDNDDTYSVQTDFAEGTIYYTKEDEVTLAADYYPVVYKSTDKADGTTATDSLDAIAADYAKKLNGGTDGTKATTNDVTTYEFTKEYDPNTDLSKLGVDNESLTWAWAIENVNQTANGADTILADLQAKDSLKNAEVVVITTGNDAAIKAPVEHTNYNLNTSFSIDIKVEQVD